MPRGTTGRAQNVALGLEGPVHGGRLEGGRAITIVVGLHFGVFQLLLVLVGCGAAHRELLVVLVVVVVAGAGVGQLPAPQVAGLGRPPGPAQAQPRHLGGGGVVVGGAVGEEHAVVPELGGGLLQHGAAAVAGAGAGRLHAGGPGPRPRPGEALGQVHVGARDVLRLPGDGRLLLRLPAPGVLPGVT